MLKKLFIYALIALVLYVLGLGFLLEWYLLGLIVFFFMGMFAQAIAQAIREDKINHP